MEPHSTECVWELAERRFVYIVEDRERAGGGRERCSFVGDLDAVVDGVSAPGDRAR